MVGISASELQVVPMAIISQDTRYSVTPTVKLTNA